MYSKFGNDKKQLRKSPPSRGCLCYTALIACVYLHTCVRIRVFEYTTIPVKCRNIYKCKIPVNNRKKEREFCNRLLAQLQPFPLFNSLPSVFPFANCCWNTFKSNDKPVWFPLIYSQLGLVKLIIYNPDAGKKAIIHSCDLTITY